MSAFRVKKVAVLGAGVMGAQIAAHLVNVKVPVVLFDLPAKEGARNGVVTKAIEGLKKLNPAPLGVADDAVRIEQANYEEHLALLKDCDLVIEAIAERMDWKHDLYAKIAPHIAPHAILASNTSGLSITGLSKGLPDALKPRFCGIHFFNPPRYMYLVELIATPATDPQILDDLETFAVSRLGKGVVRAKDTPNFIANRVGIAGILATFIEAEKFGISYDVVDDLTGKKLGRASSGTFRTADVVGLDTLAHVVKTMQDNLGPDQANDPFFPTFATPKALARLLEMGNLGQKTKAGFFKKVGRDILRFDATANKGEGEYVPAGAKADDIIGRMLKKPALERLQLLRGAKNPQARFLWAIIRDGLHYCAVHLGSIAHSARDVDLAIRWGFGWKQGPFELWQEAGWTALAQMIQEDIDAGEALCKAPLPDWVFKGPVVDAQAVHTPLGSWSPAAGAFVRPAALPVYERQLFREAVLGDGSPNPATAGKTIEEQDGFRIWTLDDEVLLFTSKTKMRAISPDVAEGLIEAVNLAEQLYKGLVIWNPDDPFSVGADLQAMLPAFVVAGIKAIDRAEKDLQDAMLRLRYSAVPTVAAVRGMALGGGCEMAIYAAKRVAAMESYVGLVEVGVGLLPGAGGLTYIARRAAENAAAAPGVDLLAFLKDTYTHAAMAKVATSALEARKLGYFLDSDVIVPNKDELLHIAISQAKAMYDAGYQPPHQAQFPVAGRNGRATIMGSLINMRDGGFISAHDFHIGSLIADVVCGGDVDAGTLVNEAYVMALERRHFCSLIVHPKTQDRILGMLSTGKPLRN
jgi:3-hydroxyacyl-CoA dehydrogenase